MVFPNWLAPRQLAGQGCTLETVPRSTQDPLTMLSAGGLVRDTQSLNNISTSRVTGCLVPKRKPMVMKVSRIPRRSRYQIQNGAIRGHVIPRDHHFFAGRPVLNPGGQIIISMLVMQCSIPVQLELNCFVEVLSSVGVGRRFSAWQSADKRSIPQSTTTSPTSQNEHIITISLQAQLKIS